MADASAPGYAFPAGAAGPFAGIVDFIRQMNAGQLPMQTGLRAFLQSNPTLGAFAQRAATTPMPVMPTGFPMSTAAPQPVFPRATINRGIASGAIPPAWATARRGFGMDRPEMPPSANQNFRPPQGPPPGQSLRLQLVTE